MTREEIRLAESRDRKKHWNRWGPYLSERAWGTVREDYRSDARDLLSAMPGKRQVLRGAQDDKVPKSKHARHG